jgi:hypothetical protein
MANYREELAKGVSVASLLSEMKNPELKFQLAIFAAKIVRAIAYLNPDPIIAAAIEATEAWAANPNPTTSATVTALDDEVRRTVIIAMKVAVNTPPDSEARSARYVAWAALWMAKSAMDKYEKGIQMSAWAGAVTALASRVGLTDQRIEEIFLEVFEET